MKKIKEYITLRKQYVYENQRDASNRENPLFALECKITSIDFTRIKSIDGVDIKYSLKTDSSGE